jgi:hypothetical protein
VSGHRTIGVIPGGGQRPDQQEVNVPGRGAGRGYAMALAVRIAR